MHSRSLLGLLASFLPLLCYAKISEAGLCQNPLHDGHFLRFPSICLLTDQSSYEPPLNRVDFGAIHVQATSNSTKVASISPSSPWTHDPICSSAKNAPPETAFCVFTDANFAAGRGISIIGTAGSVELISRNRVFHPHLSSTTTSKTASRPYEVRKLPGRGYGLIANTTLRMGDAVLDHAPVIAVQSVAQDLLFRKELWKLFDRGIEQLPKPTRDMIIALQGHEQEEGDALFSRFTTNAFELFDYDALFPETAVGGARAHS